MIAVDTNVIVRILLNDDPVQSPIAAKLVTENRVFVSLIALLETCWVLQARRKHDRRVVADELAAFIAIDTVEVELEHWAIWALDRFRTGADLADMILLMAARECSTFATFDQRLFRMPQTGAPVPVQGLIA